MKADRLTLPAGKIRTHRTSSARPYGFPWSNVARWEPAFSRQGATHGVDPLALACMSVIESDSTHLTEAGTVIERYDGHDAVPSVGLMQVKVRYWADLVPGADGYTPEGNVALAAAILARGIKTTGSLEQAIAQVYHPGVDPNGTTPDGYVGVLRSLIAEVRNATRPAPPPARHDPPAEQKHPYDVIGGGVPWRVEYGFLDNVGLNYYGYGVGHGTHRGTDHTGDDVLWPDDTLLHAPAAGRVTCVGREGEVTWGQGCGSFEDTDGGGIGNISILLDAGIKVVLGHASSAMVAAGDRVSAGQPVGRSGGMNGPHTHIEVAVNKGGAYWLVDPAPALRQAMGGVAPVAYAERLPVPQPGEFDVSWTVVAAKEGVPVLQRADLDAAPVNAPLRRGEEFEAVYIAIGNDRRPYWVSTRGARVPVEGTTGPPWLSGAASPVECPPDRLPAMAGELAALLARYERGA